ncbi:uncharacterized, partial [Tachysurus ichikawai]
FSVENKELMAAELRVLELQ